jgi:hypothetical protein
LDGDEVFALIVSSIIAIVAGGRWSIGLIRVTRFASPRHHRLILGLFPLLCILLVQGVLACCSAHEVREDAGYDVLFLAGAGAWLALAGVGLQLIGISPRDDAIEARNAAAVIAICGMWAGATLCYAGANIGEGATIWMTFIPAAAALGALILLLLLLQLFTAVSDSITLDRDGASALRLAGFLIAAGLILGRSVAGDFHSWDATWHDFAAQSWPALPLLVGAVILHRVLRPTPERPDRPSMSAGLVPAAMMVLLALIDLLVVGLPEHLRKGG